MDAQRKLREYMEHVEEIYSNGVYEKAFGEDINVDDFDAIMSEAYYEFEKVVIEIDVQEHKNKFPDEGAVRCLYWQLDNLRDSIARNREVLIWSARKVAESFHEFAYHRALTKGLITQPWDKPDSVRNQEMKEEKRESEKREYRPKVKHANKRAPKIEKTIIYDLDENRLYREEITANRSFWRKHEFEL